MRPGEFPVGSIESRAAARVMAKQQAAKNRGHMVTVVFHDKETALAQVRH